MTTMVKMTCVSLQCCNTYRLWMGTKVDHAHSWIEKEDHEQKKRNIGASKLTWKENNGNLWVGLHSCHNNLNTSMKTTWTKFDLEKKIGKKTTWGEETYLIKMTTTMVKTIGVTSWVALWGYYNIIIPLQQKKGMWNTTNFNRKWTWNM